MEPVPSTDIAQPTADSVQPATSPTEPLSSLDPLQAPQAWEPDFEIPPATQVFELQTYAETAKTLEWRVVGASVEGGSHRKTGMPCQDAWQGITVNGDILLLAIADGAGSASLSQIGSLEAARAAVEQAKVEVTRLIHQERIHEAQEHEWQASLKSALQAARDAVIQAASECQVPERELATTLILIMATPDLVAAAQVGDGAVVVGDLDGQILALTKPQHGEYINQTTFIVSPLALESAQFMVRRAPRQRVAAFTDGLQMLALNLSSGTAHAPFFEPMFRFTANAQDESAAQQKLRDFLHSARVQERTDDDLTLVLASLEPTAAERQPGSQAGAST